jgi:hypothetical protein
MGVTDIHDQTAILNGIDMLNMLVQPMESPEQSYIKSSSSPESECSCSTFEQSITLRKVLDADSGPCCEDFHIAGENIKIFWFLFSKTTTANKIT